MKTKILFIGLSYMFTAIICGATEWKALFNGKDLEGWTIYGGEATYEVQDGAIVGINGPGHNTFLCTDATFSDFELEFEVLLDSQINSGVQIRSKVREEQIDGADHMRVYGPQVEIEQTYGVAGYIYGEAGGDWMTPDSDRMTHSVFKDAEWNHYRVFARGDRIQVWINNVQISDLYRPEIYRDQKEGFIALQVHSFEAPTGTHQIKWKNIRIREFETDGWVSMFNGKDLSGWTPKINGYELGENPGNIFRVEDGVLKVSYDAFDEFESQYGHIFYDQSFSSYKLRLEYRFVGDQAPGGPDWAFRNSGVMVHGQEPESMKVNQAFPDSIEIQFLGAREDEDRPTANVCTPGTKYYRGGQVIEEHCINSFSKSFAGDQWVLVEVHVLDSKEIVHFVNGHEVLRYQNPQLDDGTLLEKGFISLQAESHGCEFRNIEIKQLCR